MPQFPGVCGFIMAGGAGSRLQPLTTRRCKPGLSFAGEHRVVDFVLGNFFNSGLQDLRLLVQYEPASLVAHVQRRWPGVTIAPAAPGAPYRGTADAVRANLAALQPGHDLVAVFGADHVYRMDLRQMIDFHRRHGADVTVATLPVPLAEAGGLGIVRADAEGRVHAFDEKPAQPQPAPGRPGQALASMGNYLFNADVLRHALAAQGDDFGHHVLPALLRRHRVMAYDFETNHVPNGRPGSYWRDIGTVDAYLAAHFDTLGGSPAFALHDPAWPLAPQPGDTPALVHGGDVRCSRLGRGACVDRALLTRVVAGADVIVERHAAVSDSVLMPGARVGAGARLRRVIVDEGGFVPAGECIGFDAESDRARFPVSAGGVVVVPAGHFGIPVAPPAAPAARAVRRAAQRPALHA